MHASTRHPQGYLSYPRTESTAYPPNFDFHTLLAAQRAHPIWGEYAASLVGNFSIPKGGEWLERGSRGEGWWALCWALRVYQAVHQGPAARCNYSTCSQMHCPASSGCRITWLLAASPAHLPPGAGTDVGDHPPVTPVRCATEAELGGGDAWRLYE